MIYFTSDLHFYHDNVIKFANRPFSDSQEMNKILIKNWNRMIIPQDEVYILGDLTMKGTTLAMKILSQLNGRKYLVRGNYDKFVDRNDFDLSYFEWVKDYYELAYQNQKFILFHYPIVEWNGYFKNFIQIHGHQHNHADYNLDNRDKEIRRYDVGVDANDMKPISIEEIINFFL